MTKRYLPAVLASLATASLGIGTAVGMAATTHAASPTTFTTIDENHAISPGSPINPWNPTGNSYDTYNQLQLAYFTYSATNPNSFWPALASKWRLTNKGRTLTVWIQPGAKWSNGQPVTAADLQVSAALWFSQGYAQGFDLGSVQVLAPNEVRFSEVRGANYQLFEHELLQQDVVPASYWSTVVPKTIWKTIAQLQSSNKKVAAKANTTLTSLGKKLVDKGPKTDISAGPYVIQSVNASQAVLVKNKDFWAPQKVTADEIVMRNYTGNEQIWNYLIAGQLDFAPYTAMPTSVLNRILATPGNQKVIATSYVAAALNFNQSIYPYNVPQVRQALAYLIDRKAVQSIGEPVSGTASKWSDGMVDGATKQWLTPAQQAQLNPYNYNPAKAASLLASVGFKKTGGQWMMPNGKPWKISLYDVNGFSDWIEAGHVIASELTSAGIPTVVTIVPSYSTYVTNMEADKYAVGFWIIALGPNPYAAFNRIYGTADGYQVIGGKVTHVPATNPQNGNFVDTPQILRLPGGGSINPGQATYHLSQSINVKALKPVVAELALATNSDLPMLSLWNYVLVQFVNTNRFTDMPVHQDGLLQYQAGLWMLQGYVHPK